MPSGPGAMLPGVSGPALERQRYGFLLLSILLLLAIEGIVPPGSLQQVVVSALAAISVVLAFRAAGLSPAAHQGGRGARRHRAGRSAWCAHSAAASARAPRWR